MEKDYKRLSKFLAVVLRHRPADFDIDLDEEGYAPLDVVLGIIREKYGRHFGMADLETVVMGEQSAKKRYEIVGNQIRALYGHSTPNIVYPASEPPEILYHGSNNKAVIAIRKEGLRSLRRQYVHMTTNLDNAIVVAKRQTMQPVILLIRAKEAYQAGLVFHQAEAEHYLAKSVPPQFIDFPE